MLRRAKIIAGIFLFALLFFGGKQTAEAATRIHYLGLKGATDAILLESDGRFGMIDSGEDWDYPSGKNSKYPLRRGTIVDMGHEQQVIYYMKSVGVTSSNFDFYLGTHAHSDHIGTGDEILAHFTPKTVYLKKYSNANISNKAALWDNRYVYDRLVKAAKAKSKLVQNIKEGMVIELGSDMKITLYNTKVRKGVVDDNWNSMVAKVRVGKTTTILAGDAVPSVMNKLAKDGKFGKIDILKLPHHGYIDGNPKGLMSRLAPKEAIVLGPMSNVEAETRKALRAKGTKIRGNNAGMAALVTTYSATGYSTSARNVKAGWLDYNNGRYYIRKSGRPATGWREISKRWYYFDKRGKAATGWVSQKNRVYYFSRNKTDQYAKGEMLTGWQRPNGRDYVYFRKSGAKTRGTLLTGWQKIDNKWYYFKKSGKNGSTTKKLTGWRKIGGKQYYFHPGKGQLDGYAYMNGTFTIGRQRCTFDKKGVLKRRVTIAKPKPTAVPKPTPTQAGL